MPRQAAQNSTREEQSPTLTAPSTPPNSTARIRAPTPQALSADLLRTGPRYFSEPNTFCADRASSASHPPPADHWARGAEPAGDAARSGEARGRRRSLRPRSPRETQLAQATLAAPSTPPNSTARIRAPTPQALSADLLRTGPRYFSEPNTFCADRASSASHPPPADHWARGAEPAFIELRLQPASSLQYIIKVESTTGARMQCEIGNLDPTSLAPFIREFAR